MSTSHASLGSRLPALGGRGEGWAVLQVVLIALLLASGLAGPAWSGDLRVGGVVVGGGLVAVGLLLMARGIAHLRRQLTPFPHPLPGGQLITDGPFRLVRHPMYAGGIVLAAGWALATASLPGLVAAGAILAFLDLKSRREETWLVEQFDGYAEYAHGTPKLIPFVY
jgi:protein-S-isoprenylcysteine O-methyltransferase Ste14